MKTRWDWGPALYVLLGLVVGAILATLVFVIRDDKGGATGTPLGARKRKKLNRAKSRSSRKPRSSVSQSQCGSAIEPTLKFTYGYQNPATLSHDPQLGEDMFVEEVARDSK